MDGRKSYKRSAKPRVDKFMGKTIVFRRVFTYIETISKLNFERYLIKIWRPSLVNIIPPKKSRKYLFYWLFHYLIIFKNRDYSALLIYDNEVLIGSMLIVPAHFKWPFMAKNDLQFTYVMTARDYRGKGIGELMLRTAIQEFKNEKRIFWYITDTENHASLRLCSKVGFEFWSYAKRYGFMKILREVSDC